MNQQSVFYLFRFRNMYRLLFLVALSAMVFTTPAQTIDTEPLYRLTTLWQGEGKSLGVMNENKPQLIATGESTEQYWKLVLEPNGFYRLINQQHTDKSLDVINDGAKNNRLVLAAINNYSGQFWKLSPNTNGTYRLTSLWQGDGKSLDIVNDGISNSEIILNPTGNYSGQFWKLTPQIILPSPLVEEEIIMVDNKDRLSVVEELLPDMKLISTNGNFTLIQQTDGNLVVYSSEDKPTWASGTYGKNVKRCIMQTDGNLVQYLPYDVPVWASNTNGNPGAYLVMQNDGNLVIYGEENRPLWASNTAIPEEVEEPVTPNKDRLNVGEELLLDMELISANGFYRLIQQKDGNLVVYNRDNKPTWASGTYGKNVRQCIMQTDGNLVQYLSNHVPVWASNTNGHAGAYLVMQNDGNLVIYGKGEKPLWASNTAGR